MSTDTKQRADALEALIWKRYPFRAKSFTVIANKLLTLYWSADAILRFLDQSYKQPAPPMIDTMPAD